MSNKVAIMGEELSIVTGLENMTPSEKEQLKERLALSAEIIKSFALAGLNTTMNTFNGK